MSHIIVEKNVNHAFMEAWWWMRAVGEREDSRNGPVLVAPGIVITEYERPWERVLFSPKRDANPVFHLMESIWMLAGEEEVGWLSNFSSQIGQFAEPNGVIHGAYGNRWRNHWPSDQLHVIIKMLKVNPTSRQAVLQMWDPDADLEGSWRDRPCNTNIYFDCRHGVLNMTVCTRSNDMLLGAYGANVVHMSFLQELMALAIGVGVGVYRQMSNNFHLYTDSPMVKDFLENPPNEPYDKYQEDTHALPLLLMNERYNDFLDDCAHCVSGDTVMVTEFMKMAVKLRDCYLLRKNGRPWENLLGTVPACDWKTAFAAWAARREKQ